MLIPESGLVALDVVLRDRIVLPDVVVRIIRRFANGDTPLFRKLRFALSSRASATDVEQLIAAHRQDEQVETRERMGEWVAPRSPSLSDEELHLVNAVAMLGAREARPALVDWALDTSTYVAVRRVLITACECGHLQVVQFVQNRRKWPSISDEELLRIAVEQGQLEVCKWLFAGRRSSEPPSLHKASILAAARGHLDVLQWILHVCGPRQLSPLILREAVASGQQHVMEWVWAEQLAVRAAPAMESAAKSRMYDDLVWLHEKYPDSALLLSTFQEMADGPQRHAAAWLLERFPERYAGYGRAVNKLRESRHHRRRWRRSITESLRSLRARLFPTKHSFQ